MICTVYELFPPKSYFLSRTELFLPKKNKSLPRTHSPLPCRVIPVPKEAVGHTVEDASLGKDQEASRLVQYRSQETFTMGEL